MAAGQDEARFWSLTLREIAVVLKGVNQRLLMERQTAIYGAWHTAFFTAYAPKKSRDFWKLKDVLPSGTEPKKRQTWQEQKAMAKVLNAAFGGEMRTRVNEARLG